MIADIMCSLLLELCPDMTVDIKDTSASFLHTEVNNNLLLKGVRH